VLERFLKPAQGHLPTEINAALHDIADGSYQLFAGSAFHHVTRRARAGGALSEDAFLKRGIHKNN
jgi:hypothetical protein